MTGESIRLGRYRILVCLGVALCGGVAWAQSTPATKPSATATKPSATQAAAAAVDLEIQIQAVLRVLATTSPADAASKLGGLLRLDVSKVAVSVKAAAYNAAAAANERLAQEARADRLDPASERNAQQCIDIAVENYVKAGQAFHLGGDYAGADQAFTKALSYRPNSTDALLGMARIYGATGRAMQAIERYQDYFKATGKGPLAAYDPSLFVEIGRVYLGIGLWHQALKAFNDAIKNGGDTDEVAALMAEAYLGLNRIKDALDQIQKAMSKAPTQPLYHSKYAQILLAQKLFKEAAEKASASIAISRDILKVRPDDPATLQVMSECYYVYAKILNAILAGDPGQTETRLKLAQCMQEQADVRQLIALHQVLNVLKSAPQQDRENVSLLEKQVSLEQAVQHRDLPQNCERLLRIDPGNKVATAAMAKLSSGPTASAPASLSIK